MTNHRSRSNSRSRSRSSRRRSGRNHHESGGFSSTRCYYKLFKETNYGAAFCSMCVIVLVFTALSEPKWIYLEGGGCTINHHLSSSIGTNQFFYQGKFVAPDSTIEVPVITAYKYGSSKADVMINCISYSTVLYFKTIIALSFIVIIFTLGAFLLDLTGPSKRPLKVLRRSGFPSVLSVILCILINFLCYCITVQVEKLQEETKIIKEAQVYVTYDVSFYSIVAAGAMSAFSTAFKCLKTYPSSDSDHQDRATLLDGCDNMTALDMPESPEIIPSDTLQIPNPPSPSQPPPEYTP